jgi:hypothetical protein
VSPSYDAANASAMETSSVRLSFFATSRMRNASDLSGFASSILTDHASALAFSVVKARLPIVGRLEDLVRAVRTPPDECSPQRSAYAEAARLVF